MSIIVSQQCRSCKEHYLTNRMNNVDLCTDCQKEVDDFDKKLELEELQEKTIEERLARIEKQLYNLKKFLEDRPWKDKRLR